MADETKERSDRGEKLYKAHSAKLRAAFEGKKYVIVKEFTLDADKKFATEFGNKGRHGFIIQNVDNPEDKKVVGATVLRRIANEFGAVDLPPETKKRTRRTKAQKAADDAQKEAERQKALELQAALIDEVLARETDSGPVSSADSAEASDEEESDDEESKEPQVVADLFR